MQVIRPWWTSRWAGGQNHREQGTCNKARLKVGVSRGAIVLMMAVICDPGIEILQKIDNAASVYD